MATQAVIAIGDIPDVSDGVIDLTDRSAVPGAVDAAGALIAWADVDIVLDDGSRSLEESRALFEALFPLLRPGARYVLEGWNAQHRIRTAIAETLKDPSAPDHDRVVEQVSADLRRRAGTPAPPPLLRLAVELLLVRASEGDVIESVTVEDQRMVVVRGPGQVEHATFRVDGAAHDHFGHLGPPAAQSGHARANPVRPALISTGFEAACAVCRTTARFERGDAPSREGYSCSTCGATLRYQGQARALLALYPEVEATAIVDLVAHPSFRTVTIYEPGELGPFRQFLGPLSGYQRSTFTPDIGLGEVVGGLRNQDLQQLTYRSRSFDLVLTSDVMEHVRHPDRAWAEIYRVLRPGGAHVFSIPVSWPPPASTTPRVDVSGPLDVHLAEPNYHNGHLVYNDFGLDLLDDLRAVGFEAEIVRFECDDPVAARLCTFVARRPASPARFRTRR